LKTLIILAISLLVSSLNFNESVPVAESEQLARAAISQSASLKKDQPSREMSDHFGDPSQFKQYIIRIPPVYS